MSIRMVARSFEALLPGSIKGVAIAMADNADDDGVCFVSNETIEWKSGKSRRATQTAIDKLELLGVLVEMTPEMWEEVAESTRRAYQAIPVNRQPTAYKLDFSAVPLVKQLRGKKSGVQKQHPKTKTVRGADSAPQDEAQGRNFRESGAQLSRSRGAESAPKLLREPSENDKTPSSLRSEGAPPPAQRPTVEVSPILTEILDSEATDLEVWGRLEALGWTQSETQHGRWTDLNGQVHDLVFEALAYVCQMIPAEMTVKGRRSFNTALEEIRKVPGAGPVEVIIRGRRYWRSERRRPTAHDLSKKWAELNEAADVKVTTGQIRQSETQARLDRALTRVGGDR